MRKRRVTPLDRLWATIDLSKMGRRFEFCLWVWRRAQRLLPTQPRKLAGDTEQKDHPDNAAVRCTRPGDQVVKQRMLSACVEGSAHRGGHHRIHRHQTESKCGQAKQSARGPAQ